MGINRGKARTRVFIALLSGIAGVSGSYAVSGSTRDFVIAPISSFVVNNTPPVLITFSIEVLGELGHKIGFILSLLIGVGVFSAISFVGILMSDRFSHKIAPALLSGLATFSLTLGLVSSISSALGTAIPVLVLVGSNQIGLKEVKDKDYSEKRRGLLVRLVGILSFSGLAYIVGERNSDASSETTGSSIKPKDRAEVKELLSDAEEKSLNLEGIPGLVTETQNFYEIDINSIDPSVDAESWSLEITGEVENSRTVTYRDLLSMPSENRHITLRCVGDKINGDRMDSAVWTGVPIIDLIEDADPNGDYVMLRADDGFYEEFSVDALRDGFLAYGMNNQNLSTSHGYPVRALIPGHWGEINVKWVTEIEILENEQKGYWEEKGWHGTGPVNTVAKIEAMNELENGVAQVGGHAYAGTRGIEKVEVSVDGGESWNQAKLNEPLDGNTEDIWRQWKYEWELENGGSEVVVRAIDGDGDLQPKKEQQPYPSGATGWVSKKIDL